MTIKEIQEEIIDEFESFEDWMERYDYMIELGKSLPEMEESLKGNENLIKGCQSKVWVHSEMQGDKLHFFADSDAILTKGIVALLLRVYSDQTPQDILNNDLFFIDQIGLKEHLSPTRANGLVSMIKQFKLYALAYQTKLS
ncbi:SufE family protein [Namhaeicola litoreus]|uniref:SufE family protein n=1 Tax=Namhaeicola litoreus TaxID=1052145 RepID=A0ABW3Y039_9FLAO